VQFLVEAYARSSGRGAAEMQAMVGEEAERRGLRYVGTVHLPEDEVAFHVFESPDRAALMELLSDARVDYNRISAALADHDLRFVNPSGE
jgi:hypothetical protein